MTQKAYRPLVPARLVEFVMMLAVVAGFINLVMFFTERGYLPAPFVFDVTDTFMDWFNTANYAHNPGAYDVWGTVYAPLSFVFLKIFGDGACYHSHAKDARDCDVLGIATIITLYVLTALTAALAFRRNDRPTAFYRSVGYALSLPLLYSLERGNIILASFVFFNLLFGNLLGSRRWVALAAAMLINFKTYLLMPVLVFGLRRDWRTLEICGFATVFLYLATLAILGAGTPLELQNNITIWFRVISSNVWDQVYYSTTYAPYLEFDTAQYPIRDFIDQRTIDIAKLFVQTELVASKTIALLCILCAWFYPKAITQTRLVFFILMQSFVTQSPGGYGLALVIFLVFMEPWKNARTGLALVLAYLACVPADHILSVFFTSERGSWLAQRDVHFQFGISVGALFRPGLIVVILWSLAIDSLIDFHRAVKTERPILGLATFGRAPAPLAAA